MSLPIRWSGWSAGPGIFPSLDIVITPGTEDLKLMLVQYMLYPLSHHPTLGCLLKSRSALKDNFRSSSHILKYLLLCAGRYSPMPWCVCGNERRACGKVLFFHPMVSGEGTQVSRLATIHLYLLSHPDSHGSCLILVLEWQHQAGSAAQWRVCIFKNYGRDILKALVYSQLQQ